MSESRHHWCRGLRRVCALFLAVAALTFVPTATQADELTYCVGGFTRGVYGSSSACRGFAHVHMYVTDGAACFECWDQLDQTCETVFLVSSKWAPSFRAIDPFQCFRMKAAAPGLVVAEVREGIVLRESVQTAPPPAPSPAHLTTQIELPPGVFGPGESLTMRARVVDQSGATRAATSAVVSIVQGDTRSVVPSIMEPDGRIRAAFIPLSAGTITLTVEPAGVALLPGEGDPVSLSSSASMHIEDCRARAQFTSPVRGSSVLLGEELHLAGAVLDRNGQPFPVDLAAASWHIRLSGQSLHTPAISNGSALTGTLALPKLAGQHDVEVTLDLGPGPGLCASAPVHLQGSDLGVSLSAAASATRCFVGVPCTLLVSLSLVPSAPSTARAFIASPDLRIEATMNGGKPALLSPVSPGVYSLTYFAPSPLEMRVAFKATAMGRSVEGAHNLTVRWPLTLRVPESLDFGRTAVGDRWLEHCVTLSFAGSRGGEEQSVLLSYAQPQGCEAAVVWNADGIGVPLGEGIPAAITLDASLQTRLCLRPPRCGTSRSDDVILQVTPADPLFAKEATHVVLRWSTTGNAWWQCYRGWLTALGALAIGLFVARGFVSPKRFLPGVSLRLHRDQRHVATARLRPLRDLPGGRGGWYKSARVGFLPDGDSAVNTKRALFALYADPLGVRVRGHQAPIRVWNRHSRKLEALLPGQAVLTTGIVYECGGLWFMVS